MKLTEEKLIETVRGFDCTWKESAKVYRDARAKENAWKAVAREVSYKFMKKECN